MARDAYSITVTGSGGIVPLVDLPAITTGQVSLAQVENPLPAGEAVTVTVESDGGSWALSIDDVIDTTAPTMPGILRAEAHSARVGSCGYRFTNTWVEIEIVRANDDYTPADRLEYLVYLGITAAEAQAVLLATDLVIQEDSEPILRASGARDLWVAVAAVDQAGNIGPRSDAVLAR